MRPLRILITNVTLASRTGTELFTRDLALGLRRAGQHPAVYTPDPGSDLAEELRASGVPVADDPGQLERPDLIHGHHSLPCLTVLTHFAATPALFMAHDRLQWTDAPPRHPRVLRYVAVDDNCLERLTEAGIPAERSSVVRNAVDLERFPQRPPLPDRPRRALLFSNYASEDAVWPAVRDACAREGLSVEVAGEGMGKPLRQPEEVLGRYDLVFAKARCALEAMAVGCAVILCDQRGVGGLVAPDEFDRMRRLNFGMRTLTRQVETQVLRDEIRRYDAARAGAVTARVREEATLPRQVDAFLSLYRAVVGEPLPTDAGDESSALAQLLQGLLPQWTEHARLHREIARLSEEMSRVVGLEHGLRAALEAALAEAAAARRLARERDAARNEARLRAKERDRTAARIRAIEGTATWRLRSRLLASGIEGPARALFVRVTGRKPGPDRNVLPMPVIVGAPCSGTTLLRLMLDAHPTLAIPQKTGFLAEAARLGGGEGLREALFRLIRDGESWTDFGLPEEDLRRALETVDPATVPDAVRAFYRLYAARGGKTRWGDETPEAGLHIPDIARLLPEAHFIHVIRDGRDAAVSVRPLHLAPGGSMGEVAEGWRRHVEAARSAGPATDRYLEVRYEDLVPRPEAALREVCAFVDLPFDARQLECDRRAPEPLLEHGGRVDAGERMEMTEAERAEFEEVAGPLLRELGYDSAG